MQPSLNAPIRLLFATLVLAAGLCPASAMVLSGGAGANEQAKLAGAGTATAVCLLESVWEDDYGFGTGTLIHADPKTGKGTILTAAHCVVGKGKPPAAIAISFEANPLRDLKRIPATGFRTHPDYVRSPKAGPDLALVEFTLPDGFAVEPMLLPGPVQLRDNPGRTHWLTAGYGDFAFNGHAEAKEESKHPDWIKTRDDGRVRRLAYLQAEYHDAKTAEYGLPAFQTFNFLASQEDMDRAEKQLPFRFETSNRDLFRDGGLYWEAVPFRGDSGGPLFQFDPETGRLRVAAVVVNVAFGTHNPTGKPCAQAVSVALTAELLPWLEGKGAGPMQKVGWTAMNRMLVTAVNNHAFKLGLSADQILSW